MLKKKTKSEDELEDDFYDDDYGYRDEAELETAKTKLDRAIFEICKTTDEPHEIVSQLASTEPGLVTDVFGDGEEEVWNDVVDYIEGNSYTDPVSGETLGFTEWFEYFNVCEEEDFESRFEELYDRCKELYQENCSQKMTIAKLSLENKRYKHSQEKWENLRTSVIAEMYYDAEDLQDARCLSDRDMLVEIVESLLNEYKAKNDYEERLKTLEADITKGKEDARLRKIYEEQLKESVSFSKLKDGIIRYAKEYNEKYKDLKDFITTLSCIVEDPLWIGQQTDLLREVSQVVNEAKPIVNHFHDQSKLIDNSKSINIKADDEDKLLPK